MKNALRGMCAVVVACGVGVESGERFEAHKNEVREIFKQTQVRVSCVTPLARLRLNNFSWGEGLCRG